MDKRERMSEIQKRLSQLYDSVIYDRGLIADVEKTIQRNEQEIEKLRNEMFNLIKQ